MSDWPIEQQPELADFASGAVLYKYAEVLQRLTFGAITIGRYRHTLNKGINAGAMVGTSQCTVTVYEGSAFEMDWSAVGAALLERKRIEYGDIQLHPCNTIVYKKSLREQVSIPSQMLFFAIDQAFVDQVIAAIFGRFSMDLEVRIGIQDPVIGGMAETWREELRTCGAGGRMSAEALATTLIVHLFRTYGSGKVNLRAITGGITSSRLRRVVEYMEEHLSDAVGLCALASMAGFSIHHFGDVFKAETGFTPHQYLINRRIHKAKELLLGSSVPIAEIATEVGFSGQSHFNGHFRKLTGMTPLHFRRAKGARVHFVGANLKKQKIR